MRRSCVIYLAFLFKQNENDAQTHLLIGMWEKLYQKLVKTSNKKLTIHNSFINDINRRA